MFGPEHVSRVRQLYKLILRVHRGLPGELRIMGNNYTRDEFKRHKNCKPEEACTFLNEWTEYAINLAKQLKPLRQAKTKTVGKPLDPQILDHMSDEQLVQLYELHQAARDPAEDEPNDSAGDAPKDTPKDPSVVAGGVQETQLNGNTK